jgi:hypothetical protein
MIKKYKDHSKSIKKTNLNNEIKNKKKNKKVKPRMLVWAAQHAWAILDFFFFFKRQAF